MAKRPPSKAKAKKSARPRIRLQGAGADEAMGPLEVRALDRGGDCIAAMPVEKDGTFDLSSRVLAKAHRVTIGPGGEEAEEAPQSVYLTYRVGDFKEALERRVIDIAEGVWKPWFPWMRCVSGSVWRCYPSGWWYQDLIRAASRVSFDSEVRIAANQISRVPPTADLSELIVWPRCHKICFGKIEVHRRVCCCEPWIVYDPRLPDLVDELEDIVRGIPEIPEVPGGPEGPPRPPGPQPDPAPIRDAFFSDGTLDERALRARHDLEAIRTLPAVQVAEYINMRPYLLCRSYRCGSPVKVAEGTIGPDGRFNICWKYYPTLLPIGCHEEFAYKVKQKRGPFWWTVYNGVAANQWFDSDDEAVLKTFSPFAIACRDNGGKGDPVVYLDVIGDTGSQHLGTPLQDSATSVQTPSANSGVVFPLGGPPGGSGVDRNWGGTLKLNVMFSEALRGVGAKYYRISVSRSNSAGDPVGNREYVSDGLSWRKSRFTATGHEIVPVTLGPVSVGGQNHLYQIPYDGDLPSNEDWEANQYHAHLNTAESRWAGATALHDPNVRHLVTIEVFDQNGERLRPNGTPATGLGGAEKQAGFSFRRKYQEIGSTDMVPYGALTHMFWWDNRDVEVLITDLAMNGVKSDEECQFLAGAGSSTFGIAYRAYHPEELFQQHHSITWRRGLSGGSGTLLPATHANVGVPPNLPGNSPTDTFANMLEIALDPTRTKCAFTVFLTILNKRTDGDDLGYAKKTDSAAFALEIV